MHHPFFILQIAELMFVGMTGFTVLWSSIFAWVECPNWRAGVKHVWEMTFGVWCTLIFIWTIVGIVSGSMFLTGVDVVTLRNLKSLIGALAFLGLAILFARIGGR